MSKAIGDTHHKMATRLPKELHLGYRDEGIFERNRRVKSRILSDHYMNDKQPCVLCQVIVAGAAYHKNISIWPNLSMMWLARPPWLVLGCVIATLTFLT